MSIFKRGGVYWYEFRFNGERIRESADTGDKNKAMTIMAAHRTNLAMGKVGIVKAAVVPTLAEFAPRFESAIVTLCADKPATVKFYREKLKRLLEDGILPSTRLDGIDEGVIDSYKQRRSRQASRYGRPMMPASVNRELATLRRLLRLAQEWKVLDRVPRVRLLRGERNRDFVLNHSLEPKYLKAAPQPLRDVALLILDTGVRPGEAANLRWPDVYIRPAAGAKYGYLNVREGKSQNAKRNLSLTARVAAMLAARKKASESKWVFPGDNGDGPILGTSLDHQHDAVRTALKLPKDFVIHSLRHTMLTRLGESGAEAFTIMKIAGHSSVTVSQRYVHPTPEGMERAFQRMEELNQENAIRVEAEAAAESRVPTKPPTVKKKSSKESLQVVDNKGTGP